MLELFQNLWGFTKERKNSWLFPIILLMLLLGLLIVAGKGSAVAPFIYTLFWCFKLFKLTKNKIRSVFFKSKNIIKHSLDPNIDRIYDEEIENYVDQTDK